MDFDLFMFIVIPVVCFFILAIVWVKTRVISNLLYE